MKKRIFSALLCAGLLAFAPVSAVESTPIGGAFVQGVSAANSLSNGVIHDFADLVEASRHGGEYELDKPITINQSITLSNLTLDLNGYSLTVNSGSTLTLGNQAALSGSNVSRIFVIGGRLAMHSGSSLNTIGISILQRGSFTMSGGEIVNNTQDGKPGVYIDDGTFTMSGGFITYNSGGGVVLENGTFNLSGGSVNRNVDCGVIVNGGTFKMSSGRIYGNGIGIVCNGGEITMSGGSVLESTNSGVWMNGGRFTMTGSSSISGNKSSGVYIHDGSFTMANGSISNNIVSDDYGPGGGVRIETSEGKNVVFNMLGGEITGNRAAYGGGVYIESHGDPNGAVFNMTGGNITGNTAREGGGAAVFFATFKMTGGRVSGNSANIGSGIGYQIGYARSLSNGMGVIELSGSTLSFQDHIDITKALALYEDDYALDVSELHNSPSVPVYIEIPKDWLLEVSQMQALGLFEDGEYSNYQADMAIGWLLNFYTSTISSDRLNQFRFVITENGQPLYYPVVEYRTNQADDKPDGWYFKWDESSAGNFVYTVDYTELVDLCTEIHDKMDEVGLETIPPVLADAFDKIDWNLENTAENEAVLQEIIDEIRAAYEQWLSSLNLGGEGSEEEPEEEEVYIPSTPISDGWKYYSSGTMYYKDGKRTRGLAEIDGETYYFDDRGFLQYGWKEIEPDSSNWYHFGEDGAMDFGWYKEGNAWYYLDPETGLMYNDGPATIGKSTYYFYDWGGMASDWWYEDEAGDWYFFGGSGAMKAAQWLDWKGDWYYLTETGRMAVDTEIGGYYVNADGVWAE